MKTTRRGVGSACHRKRTSRYGLLGKVKRWRLKRLERILFSPARHIGTLSVTATLKQTCRQ